jgi:hypothetical protein
MPLKVYQYADTSEGKILLGRIIEILYFPQDKKVNF